MNKAIFPGIKGKASFATSLCCIAAALVLILSACSTSSSESAATPGASESAATPAASESAAAPAAAGSAASPGAPDWPTTQQAIPLNPSAQGQCPDLLNDSKYTAQVVFDNQRGYRYAEAFITCPGQPQPGIFNTTGFNIRPENSRDSIPDSIFQGYSDSAVQQDYGATAVFMEETRYWMMDKLRILLGNNIRNLDGLDTRFGAFTKTAPSATTGASNAYKIAAVTRDSTFYFNAGQPVFILDAPQKQGRPRRYELHPAVLGTGRGYLPGSRNRIQAHPAKRLEVADRDSDQGSYDQWRYRKTVPPINGKSCKITSATPIAGAGQRVGSPPATTSRNRNWLMVIIGHFLVAMSRVIAFERRS